MIRTGERSSQGCMMACNPSEERCGRKKSFEQENSCIVCIRKNCFEIRKLCSYLFENMISTQGHTELRRRKYPMRDNDTKLNDRQWLRHQSNRSLFLCFTDRKQSSVGVLQQDRTSRNGENDERRRDRGTATDRAKDPRGSRKQKTRNERSEKRQKAHDRWRSHGQ